MSLRPINVLLLLSSAQKPDPIEELDILENESIKSPDGITHFVATRRCTEYLTPGESAVAFFGDHLAKYKLLGNAVYLDRIEKESDGGNSVGWNWPGWMPSARHLQCRHSGIYADVSTRSFAIGIQSSIVPSASLCLITPWGMYPAFW